MGEENKNQYDPVTNEKLTDHNYDGIKELDNPLPRWRVQFFYLTIIFSFGYVFYYHIESGPSIEEQYRKELSAHEVLHNQKQEEGLDFEKIKSNLNSTEVLALGQGQFKTKCASCHGVDGGGGIGPNLADAYWIHGDGGIEGIVQVVQEGVAANGMPPWKALMKSDELIAVSSYVYSLKGTSPTQPKAPQGDKID